MAAARAANRDDQVGLALGEVLREQVVEQRVQVLVELVELAVAVDELDHPLVVGPVSGRRSAS